MTSWKNDDGNANNPAQPHQPNTMRSRVEQWQWCVFDGMFSKAHLVVSCFDEGLSSKAELACGSCWRLDVLKEDDGRARCVACDRVERLMLAYSNQQGLRAGVEAAFLFLEDNKVHNLSHERATYSDYVHDLAVEMRKRLLGEVRS